MDDNINLTELINLNLSQTESLKEQLSKFRDMLQSIYENDPTYQLHDAAVKEAQRVRNGTKKQIEKQPQVADLKEKVNGLKASIKDANDILSGYLDQYAKSGQTSLETPSGEVRQIIYVAKLVKVGK